VFTNLVNKHDILKMDEPILLQIITWSTVQGDMTINFWCIFGVSGSNFKVMWRQSKIYRPGPG